MESQCCLSSLKKFFITKVFIVFLENVFWRISYIYFDSIHNSHNPLLTLFLSKTPLPNECSSWREVGEIDTSVGSNH